MKRRRSQAATERRDAAIAILQVEQPGDASIGRFARAFVNCSEIPQCQQCSRSIIGIRNAARQVGPGPATGWRVCVGMALAVLLIEEPTGNGRWPMADGRMLRQRLIQIDDWPLAIG